MAAHSTLMDPVQHAARGALGSLAAITTLLNLMRNRKYALALSKARFVRPSRSIAAIAVFVGVFRFVQRLGANRKPTEAGASFRQPSRASVPASLLGLWCVDPRNRSMILSLLSTNAISLFFRDFAAKHPEYTLLQCAELLVFMAASGWIYYSGFFHPKSYEPNHLRLIMKYVLLDPDATARQQDSYAEGRNPSPCTLRHPGQSCTKFLLDGKFAKDVVLLGFQVYFPVHFMAWVVSLRHRKVRETPLSDMALKFVHKLSHSAMYLITYVFLGWSFSCCTQKIGNQSLAMRKLQFALAGSLPAAALLFESPSRRRPIGVILISYVAISVGTVLSQGKFPWLKQGSGRVRSAMDLASVAAAVAYTITASLDTNSLLRRVLMGSKPKPTPKSATGAPAELDVMRVIG